MKIFENFNITTFCTAYLFGLGCVWVFDIIGFLSDKEKNYYYLILPLIAAIYISLKKNKVK